MKRFKKVYLEITNVCNMNCSFCHGTKREKAFMDEEHFTIALEKLKEVTDYLYFHLLGEPLCHPNIREYIEKAHAMGFKVSITTNGTLIDDSFADLPLYKVSISLHSFEKENEEEKRRYLQKVCSFAKKASSNSIIVSFRLWNRGVQGISNAFTEDYLKENFEEFREGRSDSVTLGKGIYLEYAHRFEWPDIESTEEKKEKFCYGLKDQIGVLSDGRVVPCCLDAEGDVTLGNIFESPIEEIVNSKRALAISEGFSKRQAAEALCKKCKYAQRF